MRAIIGIAAMALLGGCASADKYAALQEEMGYMSVFEADRPDHDYKFYVKNDVGSGGNIDDRGIRNELVRQYLTGECAAISVVQETFLPLGNARLSQKKRGTYIMRVKCLR